MINKTLTIIILVCIFSCSRKDDEKYSPQFSDQNANKNNKNEIVFAPHPLHNPQRLQEMFGPIIDILNKEIPEVHFVLESSKSYSEYNEKIKSKRIDILLPNPYQTILALKNDYNVFGKMSDDFNFRGIILVKKDSPIKSIKDLKGKTISFPAPTAVSGSMMIQYYLQKHGINVKAQEINPKYVGSQESSILAAYHNEVDAAGTWPMAWNSYSSEKNHIKNELRILLSTETLINNSLMAKKDFNKEYLEKIKKVFLSLQNSTEGQRILSRMMLSKFELSNNGQYKIAKNFFEDYKKTFGSLPE
jgi:phosphonate transport system substrate-binding protein